MENAVKEHEIEVALKMMEYTKEQLYDFFFDVFGEDAADDLPETADGIEVCFEEELRHCGKQVDASKIYEIMSAIHSMKEAEKRFHSAYEAMPENPDLRSW